MMSGAPTVEEFLPLVHALAVRLAQQIPGTVELDDLKQAGSFGLLDAIAKFDPSKGVGFATYAKFRIRGAMLDHLRAIDWESRKGRRKRNQIERTISELRSATGLQPEPLAIAAALGVSLEQYLAWELELACLGPVQARADEDGETIDIASAESCNPHWLAEYAQARAILRQLTAGLTARSQTILRLYYDEGLTFSAIAERIGVNESRISQIHKACLTKLAAGLKARNIRNSESLLSGR